MVAFGIVVGVVALGFAVVLLLALHAVGRGSPFGTVGVLLVETLALAASLPLASHTHLVVPAVVALVTGTTVWLTLREDSRRSRAAGRPREQDVTRVVRRRDRPVIAARCHEQLAVSAA